MAISNLQVAYTLVHDCDTWRMGGNEPTGAYQHFRRRCGVCKALSPFKSP